MLPNNRCGFNAGLIYLWGSLFYTSMERSTIALVTTTTLSGTISELEFQLKRLQNIKIIMKILEIKDEFEDEYDFDLVIIIKKTLICVQPYITTRWNLQLKRQLTLLLVRS